MNINLGSPGGMGTEQCDMDNDSGNGVGMGTVTVGTKLWGWGRDGYKIVYHVILYHLRHKARKGNRPILTIPDPV